MAMICYDGYDGHASWFSCLGLFCWLSWHAVGYDADDPLWSSPSDRNFADLHTNHSQVRGIKHGTASMPTLKTLLAVFEMVRDSAHGWGNSELTWHTILSCSYVLGIPIGQRIKTVGIYSPQIWRFALITETCFFACNYYYICACFYIYSTSTSRSTSTSSPLLLPLLLPLVLLLFLPLLLLVLLLLMKKHAYWKQTTTSLGDTEQMHSNGNKQKATWNKNMLICKNQSFPFLMLQYFQS